MALSSGHTFPRTKHFLRREGRTWRLVDTLIAIPFYRGSIRLFRLPFENRWCPGSWDYISGTTAEPDPSSEAVRRLVLKNTKLSCEVLFRVKSMIWAECRYAIAWRLHPYLVRLDGANISGLPHYIDAVVVPPEDLGRFDDPLYPYISVIGREAGLVTRGSAWLSFLEDQKHVC